MGKHNGHHCCCAQVQYQAEHNQLQTKHFMQVDPLGVPLTVPAVLLVLLFDLEPGGMYAAGITVSI
jgi:hypothetical protein